MPNGRGRPKGATGLKTREVANRAIAAGITPLEVMLEAMHDARSRGLIAMAAGFARDAAPYVHPRLAAITATVEHAVDISGLTIAEISRELARLDQIPPQIDGRVEAEGDTTILN